MHDGSNNHNSSNFTNILDTYGLSQLISEPTRITPSSRTLIDLCITSSPEKISNTGVVHLGISENSLVFMTLKICYEQTGIHRTIETRVFKNFNHHHFLDDVAQQPWNRVFSETNPNAKRSASLGNLIPSSSTITWPALSLKSSRPRRILVFTS